MAPIAPTLTVLHSAINGTHPHHCEHLTVAAAVVSVSPDPATSTSSVSSAVSSVTETSHHIMALGYVAMGLVAAACLALGGYWIYTHRKHRRAEAGAGAGSGAGFESEAAVLETTTALPRGIVDMEGRHSLGSSVRSVIGTQIDFSIVGSQSQASGLRAIVEEGSTSAAQMKKERPGSSSSSGSDPSSKKSYKGKKKVVAFTPGELGRYAQHPANTGNE